MTTITMHYHCDWKQEKKTFTHIEIVETLQMTHNIIKRQIRVTELK